ncbi:MAG: hypothetical protein ACOX4U_00165 [Anaerovoracaceae bacterium]|jgi:hypothetical protein
MGNNRLQVRALAANALLLALAMVFLFFASFVPAIELSLQVLASFTIAAAIVETGILGGVLLYIALFLLALILLPNKLVLLPFFFLFGPYPCIRKLVEPINSRVLRLILKLITFNGLLYASWLLFKEILLGSSILPNIPLWIILLAAQPMFLLYDYVLKLAIEFYGYRIHKRA